MMYRPNELCEWHNEGYDMILGHDSETFLFLDENRDYVYTRHSGDCL